MAKNESSQKNPLSNLVVCRFKLTSLLIHILCGLGKKPYTRTRKIKSPSAFIVAASVMSFQEIMHWFLINPTRNRYDFKYWIMPSGFWVNRCWPCSSKISLTDIQPNQHYTFLFHEESNIQLENMLFENEGWRLRFHLGCISLNMPLGYFY